MLKSIYDTLDAIPEGERTHYAFSDGKYVLQLDDAHPVIKKNVDLLREKTADKAAITRLTNEKTTLEATSLPAGHVAVPAADAQLLASYKTHGTPDELATAKTERDTLKTENATVKRSALLKSVSEAEGWPVALLEASGANLEFEIRDVEADGKTTKRAHVLVKSGDRVEAKLFKDFAASDEKFKPLLPLVEAAQAANGNGGTQYIQQPGPTPAPAPGDVIGQRLAAKEEARKANRNPLMPAPLASK
jgi:hypothetical protein